MVPALACRYPIPNTLGKKMKKKEKVKQTARWSVDDGVMLR